MTTRYDQTFFRNIQDGSLRSACRIVPWLLGWLPARSVVDFGCGTGAWLSVFRQQGLGDTLGIDGSYVDTSRLLIPLDCFRPMDLTQPVELGRRFDLAMSLEVGEHLPPARAAGFVEALTRHSDVVLFSAAVPGQGGTEHVNEQWPAYWAKLFHACGYACLDPLRLRFWEEGDVEWWYAQNALLYVKSSRLAEWPALPGRLPEAALPVSLVHPKLLAGTLDRARYARDRLDHLSLREVLVRLPGAARRAIGRRCGAGPGAGDSAGK